MKYLEQYGLSEKEIDKIYEGLTYEEWLAISTYRTRIEGILEYFKSIGIDNIKNIFSEAPHIFLYSENEVKKLFNECNDSEIVSKINDDAMNIDLLF